MAELQNYVFAVLALLFITSGMTFIFSNAIINNVASGGNASTTFPLLNQSIGFTNNMTIYSQQLANGTNTAAGVTSSPALLGGGIGAITTAGTGAISLAFNSVFILLGMLSTMGATVVPLGVPGIVVTYGLLFIVIGVVFSILAGVFKWWL